ncbi:MAG TPA: hypothetical protein ENK57_17315, partial [Polyangiaceae bacterium]|nr:hypothetical protein [Polyangiaceae bacterium]
MVSSRLVNGSCRWVSQALKPVARGVRLGLGFELGPSAASLARRSERDCPLVFCTSVIHLWGMLTSRAMKYRVTLDDVSRDVHVVVTPDGRVSVSLDGVPQQVDVVRVPGGLSLKIGARVFDLAVGGPPSATQLAAGHARALAEVISDRMRARTKASAAGSLGSKDGEIRAPMPGRVVKVLVSVGQKVEADEPCLVIE